MNEALPEPSRAVYPAAAWNTLVASFPAPHLLQSWEWGQSKIRNGWQPFHLIWDLDGSLHQLDAAQADIQNPNSKIAASALLLKRAIPLAGFAARLSVMYVPKGPLLRDWADTRLRRKVLEDLRLFARRQAAIFIKIDPDLRLGTGVPGDAGAWDDPLGLSVRSDLETSGWHFSTEQVQFRNTVLLDLTPAEDDLLARMKQKTRYNVRLAQRKGVAVRQGSRDDIDLLYRMYAETASRDGFVIRDAAYYRDLWLRFVPAGDPAALYAAKSLQAAANGHQPLACALIAEVGGEPSAAIMVFLFGRRAWYLFGMSRSEHREKMPNHLLQWEAIRLAKAAGCLLYDLWGAPDEFVERDPLWGVWRFKEGLGGQVVRHLGAWDLPIRPALYRLYTQLLPRLLDLMRRRARTRQAAGG